MGSLQIFSFGALQIKYDGGKEELSGGGIRTAFESIHVQLDFLIREDLVQPPGFQLFREELSIHLTELSLSLSNDISQRRFIAHKKLMLHEFQ